MDRNRKGVRSWLATAGVGAAMALSVAGCGDDATSTNTVASAETTTTEQQTTTTAVETTTTRPPRTTTKVQQTSTEITVTEVGQDWGKDDGDIYIYATVENLTDRRIEFYRGVLEITLTDPYGDEVTMTFGFDEANRPAAKKGLDPREVLVMDGEPGIQQDPRRWQLAYHLNQFIPTESAFYDALGGGGGSFRANWHEKDVVYG